MPDVIMEFCTAAALPELCRFRNRTVSSPHFRRSRGGGQRTAARACHKQVTQMSGNCRWRPAGELTTFVIKPC